MGVITTPQWANSTAPQIQLEVIEKTETTTYITYNWTLRYVAHGYAASTAGVEKLWKVTIGNRSASGTFDIDGITGTRTIDSGVVTIQKTTSAQTLSCSCAMAFNIKWSGVYGGTKTASGTFTVPAKDTYIITYNANGGYGAPGKQTKWAGSSIKLSTTTPTRTGYTFQGWATSSGGTASYQPGATYSANASITLYAVWKANTYTVTYNANGGSGAPSNQTKTYGVSLTLSSTRPTRENFTFVGWATSSVATTAEYQSGGLYTANAAVLLYAVWSLAYRAPVIEVTTLDRCTSSGNLSDEGTYGKVIFKWSTEYSVSSMKVEYKLQSSSYWTNAGTISASGTSGTAQKVFGGSLDPELSYDVRITVTDSNGSSTVEKSLGAMNFEIDFLYGGGGVAIGKPASNKGFEIAYDTLIEKNLKFTLDSILSANDTEFLKFISSGIPIFSNHFGIENGKYIQGEQSSGSLTNIIGMNTSNQVELNWTTGGLKGRVMKEIWSGTWSSGTLSGLTELPYYNILAIGVCFSATDSSENAMILGFRVGQTFVCFGAVRSGTDTRLISGMFQTTTGTNLLYYNGLSMITMSSSISSSLLNRKIYAIYGLL